MNGRAQKFVFGAVLLATMIGVAPPADASTRTRVTKLERRTLLLERDVSRLLDLVDAQQAEIRALKNADAGLKNTLMCLHAVPVRQFVWAPPEAPEKENVIRLDTTPHAAHDWSVVADDYCLTGTDPFTSHRLMVPVNPPTFFPYDN